MSEGAAVSGATQRAEVFRVKAGGGRGSERGEGVQVATEWVLELARQQAPRAERRSRPLSVDAVFR